MCIYANRVVLIERENKSNLNNSSNSHMVFFYLHTHMTIVSLSICKKYNQTIVNNCMLSKRK